MHVPRGGGNVVPTASRRRRDDYNGEVEARKAARGEPGNRLEVHAMLVGRRMTRDPKTVGPDDSLAHAAEIMRSSRINLV